MNPKYFAQEIAAQAKLGMMNYDNSMFGSKVRSAALKGDKSIVFAFRYKLPDSMLDALEEQGIRLTSLIDGKYYFDISKLVNSLC